MDLDPVLLARFQFAMTVGFHFIFPPISIGLAWLLVVIEYFAWRKHDAAYERLGRFFGGLLGITFAVGVATGITMEFQFGTNWAEYSKVVGDIFGAPLAAEALLSFFLESTFIGLYLFGRNRVSRGVHWFSILMVAVGATLSAFWIIVANSWQQTPAGYTWNAALGRAELASFYDAVFNPSTVIRFLHTMDAALIAGAFFLIGVSAYSVLRNQNSIARATLRMGLIAAVVAALFELFPLGHFHAQEVGRQQPEKLAAFEGLFETTANAPLTLFGFPTQETMYFPVKVPGLLSLLVGNNTSTVVKGLNEVPLADRPPVLISFLSFHAMVGLGMLFIALPAWGLFQLWRGRLWTDRWLLYGLIAATPLPIIACELGWIAAEVGRQPWVVYKLMRTADAVSQAVTSGEIVFSILMFGVIYALLGFLYLYLIVRHTKRGPDTADASSDHA